MKFSGQGVGGVCCVKNRDCTSGGYPTVGALGIGVNFIAQFRKRYVM